MFYWYRLSDAHDSLTPFGPHDVLTVYAMDKTIGAIQKKILKHKQVWPDKYCEDDVYVVKKKKGRDFFLHGRYEMVNEKLRRL
jgi:hypothetical protein